MDNKLLERITHYRIDLAYSKQNAYNAYKRISRKNLRQKNKVHFMNIVSITLSVLTLSCLTVYLSQTTKSDVYILVSTLLSIASLVITVSLLRYSEEINASAYLLRGEEYSNLYKKAKNIEALYNQNETIDLGDAIKYFETAFEKIATAPLIFSQDDFDETKMQIEKGYLIYSDDDFKNT